MSFDTDLRSTISLQYHGIGGLCMDVLDLVGPKRWKIKTHEEATDQALDCGGSRTGGQIRPEPYHDDHQMP